MYRLFHSIPETQPVCMVASEKGRVDMEREVSMASIMTDVKHASISWLARNHLVLVLVLSCCHILVSAASSRDSCGTDETSINFCDSISSIIR